MNPAADILQRIADGRRRLLPAAQAASTLEQLREQAGALPAAISLRAALARPGLTIIAELKKASPSAGVIRKDFPVARLAADLVAGGAGALSILTEEDHFQGNPAYLAAARQAAPGVPLLRKDFLVDPWQVWESRVLGADAVLLITALLPGQQLPAMVATAREANVECLVEVHDREELARAAAAGAHLIGVNARDLRSFKVNLGTVEALAAHLPVSVLGVAESGIEDGLQLRRLLAAGYRGVLVGTALMRRRRPGQVLQQWLAGLAAESGG